VKLAKIPEGVEIVNNARLVILWKRNSCPAGLRRKWGTKFERGILAEIETDKAYHGI